MEHPTICAEELDLNCIRRPSFIRNLLNLNGNLVSATLKKRKRKKNASGCSWMRLNTLSFFQGHSAILGKYRGFETSAWQLLLRGYSSIKAVETTICHSLFTSCVLFALKHTYWASEQRNSCTRNTRRLGEKKNTLEIVAFVWRINTEKHD